MSAGKLPDPHTIITNLEFQELHRLEDISPWRSWIRLERSRREDALEELRTYYPSSTDAPDFDGDVDAYMADARATNSLPQQLTDPQFMTAEMVTIQEIAVTHLASGGKAWELSELIVSVGSQRLINFFTRNLYGLVGTARSVAFHAFGMTRDELLRRHYPGVDLTSKDNMIASLLRGEPITPPYAQWVEGQVKALAPGAAPYPDFFQLPSRQQDVITQAFVREWETLCRTLFDAAPELFEQPRSLRTAPLAVLPVKALQEAMHNNPAVKPADICLAFLKNPEDFEYRVRELKIQAATAALLHKTGLKEEAVIPAGETVMSVNAYEIQRLLADPNVKPEAQRIAIGQTVALTGNTPTPAAQFDDIIDKHLQLIGRTFFEDAPVHNPRGVRFFRWGEVYPGQALRAHFAGRLQNLTVTRLPVTEAMLIERYGEKREAITVENVFCLAFAVEMKSSGKKSETAVLPMLLVMQPSTHDRIFKSFLQKKGVRGTGRLIAQSFVAEAAGIARLVGAYETANPISGGLPGHGKSPRP